MINAQKQNLKNKTVSVKKHASLIPVILLMLIMTLISGCDSGLFSNDSQMEYEIVGHSGLDKGIYEGTPPDKVYEESQFSVMLGLENTGKHDIVQGIINTIVEEEYVTFVDEDLRFIPFTMAGVEDYSPGEIRTETIDLQTGNLGALNSHDTEITMNLCYDYSTHFEETVCIDSNPNMGTAQKSCEVNDIVDSAGQGAPVAITEIREKIAGTTDGAKIVFEIYIENKGNGILFVPDRIEKMCGPMDPDNFVKTEEMNTISIDEVRFSSYSLNDGSIVCTPFVESSEFPGHYDISQNEFLRCTTRDPIPSAMGTFSTQLIIEFSYGYIETIEKEITIEKI